MKRFFKEYGGVTIAIFGLLMLMFFITPAGDIVKTFISDTVSQTGSQSKVETNTQGSSEVSPSPGVTYTIEYELDGGKMSTKITSYSTLTETFELPTPYKTGYNFIGWTGSNGSTPETTVTINKGSSGDLQYTANWRSNSTNVYIYNTKYISNSGVNLGTGTIEGVIGSTQTAHAPKKDGYIAPANQKVTFDNSNPKTVTFIYNPTLYAITYDLDGGTVNGLKSAYTVETNDFTLPEPTKTGFTFKGWTGSNGSTPQKSVTVSKGSSGTKSYKANWEGITYTYTVAYRSTSGKSLGSTTVQGFLGDTKTVTLPAKTGYKTPDNVSVVFDTVGSKTVTVTYEPINYNISFVKNGGTYSEPAIQYNIESSEIVLGNAYMAGAGFLGWYDNASFNGSRILSIPTGSTGNKTFYAKFSVDSYSITYYLDEGTMNGGLTTYTVNTTTFNLPTPTKTGYTFKGWTGTGLSGNTMTVTIPQGSTGDREYTAHWEINEYTYTFRYLSSTGKQLGSTTITNQFQEGEMVTPPDYAGYTTPAKQSVIWDSTTPKTIDFTYPIITYNITYYLDGGTASNLKTSYTVEDAQFRLPTPTKTGYSWEGWTGTGITEKRLSFSIPTGSTGNKEFYANWEKSSYTLTLNPNGGNVGYTSKLIEYDKAYGPLPDPTRNGYTFLGWFTASSGGTQVSSSTKMGAGNVTIYAQWKAKPADATFDYTGGVQTYNVVATGTYKLEVWGAQGGDTSPNGNNDRDKNDYFGGKGGYATGTVTLTEGQTLYIVVGGAGGYGGAYAQTGAGGYNGGATGHGSDGNWGIAWGPGGGGATHIAKVSGTLTSIGKSSFDTNGLIVAGGGGGASKYDGAGDVNSSEDQACNGGAGGGSSTNGTFGQGSGGYRSRYNTGGGGGGYYGGSARQGGSSWAHSSLSNVTTTTGQRSGNGYAKISYIG